MSKEEWKCIPKDYIKIWYEIFNSNTDGENLIVNCPICNQRMLHRYFQVPEKNDESYNYITGEWQWCSGCRHYAHYSSILPKWWVGSIKVDGNKLTPIPNILDLAYQNQHIVNKWEKIPETYIEKWTDIFIRNPSLMNLSEHCPVCNKKTLHQYYITPLYKFLKNSK